MSLGDKMCAYACLGYGDCVEKCAFGAITIKDALARIDLSRCVGCGQCAAVCPTGALTVKNEVATMWDMLQDPNRKVVVQYAPSVRVGLAEQFGMPADELATVVTAIGNHDEGTGRPVSPMAAALILADKSDVRRSRVRNTDKASFDIHDRVNYSVTKSELEIDPTQTYITLKLTVDPQYSSVMDYFEIFMGRMLLCRKAAEKCRRRLCEWRV